MVGAEKKKTILGIYPVCLSVPFCLSSEWVLSIDTGLSVSVLCCVRWWCDTPYFYLAGLKCHRTSWQVAYVTGLAVNSSILALLLLLLIPMLTILIAALGARLRLVWAPEIQQKTSQMLANVLQDGFWLPCGLKVPEGSLDFLFIHKILSKEGRFISALPLSEFQLDSRNRYTSML